MSLSILNSDLLSHLTSFLDNKTNTNFLRSCKNLAHHAKKFGYSSHIKYTLSINIMTFLHRFCQHSSSIRTVEIRGMDNPHLWLPNYVERLIFDHCAITNYLNPKKCIYVTKYLKLTDYNRYKYKTHVRINWACFPNLEELELYVHSVDLTGIEHCTKLKKMIINTMEGKKEYINHI